MRASSWSRREFLRMGATVAGMTFLAACAPTTETPDTGEVAQGAEEPQAAPETKVKVEYWDVSSPESLDGQVKEAMINRFREKHPELEVESVYKRPLKAPRCPRRCSPRSPVALPGRGIL